jgi:hypothetical protein
MKQTAVEFLMGKLFDPSTMVAEQIQWFEEAKKMEKKQMIDFAFAFSKDYTTAKEMRDYYKETFNTNDK